MIEIFTSSLVFLEGSIILDLDCHCCLLVCVCRVLVMLGVSLHTRTSTCIEMDAEPCATVSGSLLLSNWQCRHAQTMIYTTTTTVSPPGIHTEKREADDGARV